VAGSYVFKYVSNFYFSGSLSHPTANKIYIYKTGEKFPPLKYDEDINPDAYYLIGDRRDIDRESGKLRKLTKATSVTVELRLLSLLDVDESSQQFRADFMLISRWTDLRLRNPDAASVVRYDASILESTNGIWSPRVRLANRRDPPGASRLDTSVAVYNNGKVMVVQRMEATLGTSVDLRDYPFDVQILRWVVSSDLPRDLVHFRSAGREAQANSSARLRMISDPMYTFDSYREEVAVVAEAASGSSGGSNSASGERQRSFSALTISLRASRSWSAASLTLVFPVGLLCFAGCLSVWLDPCSDARLLVPFLAAVANLAFSWLASWVCPPLGYPTRLHLLLLLAYVLSAAQLGFAAYLRSIIHALHQLRRYSRTAAEAAGTCMTRPDTQFKEIPADLKVPYSDPLASSCSDFATLDQNPQWSKGCGNGAAGSDGRSCEAASAAHEAARAAAATAARAALVAAAAAKVGAAAGVHGKEIRPTGWLFRLGALCSHEAEGRSVSSVQLWLGLSSVTQTNYELWEVHVRRVDWALRVILPLVGVAGGCVLLSSTSAIPDWRPTGSALTGAGLQ